MLNSDCTYTMTAGENLHYEAEPGRWEEVDLRFREEGEGHVADRSSTIVRVSGANLEVSDRETGRGIRWVLPGPPAVNGHRARFQASGLEWTYSVTTGGVKLEATVEAPRGPRTYTFPYQVLGSGNPREGDLEVDQGGNLQGDGFEVPRAFAIGADGRTYVTGKWQLLEGQRVAYDFDDTDLPAGAYPYVLDPSTHFIVNNPDNDGHVNKWGYSYPPTNCNGWAPNFSTMYAMRTRNGDGQFNTTNAFVSWDTSSLPDDATVTWAGVEIFAQDKGSTDGRNLTADWYSAWPIDCTDASDFAQTSAIAGYPISNISTTTDTDITLEGYGTGVSKTGRTGLRMHVSGGQPAGSNFVQIWQYGSGVQPPQLNLLYSLPSAPPTITSASDAPDPVTAGAPVTFTVGWSDPDVGDSVRALICKTNSVTVEGNCAGGTWAAGAHKTTSPSTAQLTTSSSMVGTNTYYAFACDVSGACSSALGGSFTVLSPNSAPTISSATDSPDPVTAGNPVNFQVGWSDPNAGDTVRAVICKTNAVASGSCSGGAWATGSLSSSSPATASYTTTSNDVGTKSYYAFACDQSNACSGSIAGSFTVVAANSPPSATLTVLPTSGNRETTFQAQLSGSDPNGDPISYRIDWGDGAVSNSSSASHVYRNAGTYTVTGTVTDSKGASSSDSETVTVEFSNRPPSANLTVDPERGDLNTTFSATVSGSDPDGDALSYEIDWGDGTTNQGRTATHKYAEPGTYTVTGIVADQYGATNEATKRVEVCVVYTNGACAQTPVQVPTNPCRDFEVGCTDDPTYLDYPQPVSDAFQAVRPPFTPDGRILAVTANVQQVYAAIGHRCSDPNPDETCDQDLRERRFARRVRTLADKPADSADGMAYVPDLILLQEVKRSDAQNIRDRLGEMGARFQYAIAAAKDGSDEPKFERGEDGVKKHCEAHYPGNSTAAQTAQERCKRLAFLEADTAILYNTRSLTMVPGSKSHYDARYWVEEHKLCTGTAGPHTPPKGVVDDEDGDLAPDCKIKWARQYSARFTEFALGENGLPSAEVTDVVVAAATVHLVSRRKFPNQTVHAAVKDRQAEELDEHMQEKHADANVRVLGGDFNIHRCANKNNEERGDYPDTGIVSFCQTNDWWTYLTADPVNYQEAVWTARGPEDDRLVPQYKDGCVTLGSNGQCSTDRYRWQRVDFIFGLGLPVEDASHDLTCGQVAPSNQTTYNNFAPDCTHYKNEERYSDHRLVWAMLAAEDLPLP